MTGSDNELVFIPLGGAGEIGMNLSLYGYDGRFLMVDCGITFADEHAPGIDILVPDPAFIAARADALDGIVLTHAHEDHLGAVAHLWEKLRCPVYATPFAGGLLRRKLAEAGLEGRLPLTEVPSGGGVTVGAFEVSFIQLAHSIPETQALAIRTGAGTVLHVTDWKLDPAPLIGPMTDEAALRRLGDEGVIALMCDSTNVLVDGSAGSEGALRDSMIEVVGNCRGRVAVTSFASNITRIETCVRAAQANDRHVALVGRSLWKLTEIARECGYLADCPDFLEARDIAHLPRDKVLMVVTGSQGEARAALARIAAGDHPDIGLEAGDTVIFSSREIPGNERAIGRVQNALARRGVEVITERDAFVHVSGHPARDELKTLYDWVKPPLLVPIHGEMRHLTEHVRFARQCGIPDAVIAENGSVLRLHPGPAEIVDHVESGRLALDGRRLVPMDGEILRARRRIGYNGAAVATLVLDRKGAMRDAPQVFLPGLLDGMEGDADILDQIGDAIEDAVAKLAPKKRRDDAAVIEAAGRAVRRVVRARLGGRRPATQIHVVRV